MYSTRLVLYASANARGMTRRMYRKKIDALFGVSTDADVCHIISRNNGGADHPDNYDFVRGRTWNRMLSDKYDDINCFLAGREKCQKAVDVSRVFGEYDGPDAEVLYDQGERRMQRVFRELRTMERGEE